MNFAFGLSQGLIGSSLFFLIIDFMSPQRRGVAVGIGESTIYVSTAVVNVLAGQLAANYGFRPVPFYVATGFSVLGLLLTVFIKDTLDQVKAEQNSKPLSQGSSMLKQENRKKYARMMSTQPTKTDEDIVDEFTSAGGLERTPSYQTFDCVPGWTYGPPPKPNDSKWSLRDETPPICIPKCEPPRPKPQFQLLANFTDESEHEKTALCPSTSQYASTIQSAEDFVRDTGSVMVSLLLETEPDDSSWTILKHLLRRNPSYASLCFAGMALNFKDGFAWGSFPVFFQHELGLSAADTDLLIALYPLTWGFAQAAAGAASDHFGRKLFLTGGTAVCAFAMASYAFPIQLWTAESDGGDKAFFRYFCCSDILLGFGTAMVYPALQAAAADEVDPVNRGLALGFYRFARDMGYVVGAIACGSLTDHIGYENTFWVNATMLAMASSLLLNYYQAKTKEEAALAVILAKEMETETPTTVATRKSTPSTLATV